MTNFKVEKYAPVAINAMNRKSHLERCIKSLQACKGAENTEVYISVDYPPNAECVEGYNQLKDYLGEGISGFSNVYIYYQKENMGIYDNKYFIFDIVFQKYDSLIFTEDDNEFSPNFLEYMNEGLLFMNHHHEVMSVSGYSSITKYFETSNNIAFVPKSSAWGVAYCKNKWDMIQKELNKEYFEKIIKSKALTKKLLSRDRERFIYFVKTMYDDCDVMYMPNQKTIALMDVSISIYFLVEDLFQVQPVVSKVRNWGNDGSGLHAPVNCLVEQEEIDCLRDFRVQYDISDNCYKENAEQLYRESFFVEKKYVNRYIFFATLYRVMGKKMSLPVYHMYIEFLEIWGKSHVRKLYKRIQAIFLKKEEI